MKRYIAIGDIHGMKDELVSLLENVLSIQSEDTLVFIGDYVDRGYDNKGVLDYLMHLPFKNEVIFLRGNHEDMMIKGLMHDNYRTCWVMNGGRETLRDFGAATLEDIPQEYFDWIKQTRIFYAPNDDLLFVHAGINPMCSLSEQSEQDLLWIRDTFLESNKDFGFKIIHGHTPSMAGIDVRNNRINVDTGSCFGGSLSAVVLDERGNVLTQHSVKRISDRDR